jgi:hypothetical protein
VLNPPCNMVRRPRQTTSGIREAEVALTDPLREVTRKDRLYLLALSIVSITIVKTGLVPQEITTLGIVFAEADRKSLLSMLAIVILYFLLGFVIYAFSDFLVWRAAYKDVLRSPEESGMSIEDRIQRLNEAEEQLHIEVASLRPTPSREELKSKHPDIERRFAFIAERRAKYKREQLYRTLTPRWTMIARGLFEFFLPIPVGVYALYVLLFA